MDRERIFYVVGLVALLVLLFWFYQRGFYSDKIIEKKVEIEPHDLSFYFPTLTSKTRVIELDRYIMNTQTADDYYQQLTCGCG